MRIVSLLPSSTEIACLLGAADELVGISHECDFPSAIQNRPVLTASKIKVDQLSADIDRDVRRILRDALTVYDVDAAGLAAAAPDVVLTQDLCDVCAVSVRDVERALAEIAGDRVQLVSLKPTVLDDEGERHGVFGDIERVGEAIGRAQAGRDAANELRSRAASLRARAEAAVAASGAAPPRVLTIEWMDPVMVGGTWMPELVKIAGGEALVTQPGDHAPTLTDDSLRELAPDVVLVKPCGFDLERTEKEIGSLRSFVESMPWPAVESRRVHVADGNAFFNRPGPRLVESAEILCAMVHPSAFEAEAERHRDEMRLLWR